MKKLYLLLTLLGIALPYGAFLPWILNHGLDIPLLFEQALANPISIFAWLDVVVSALALIAFILVESKRAQVRNSWLAILGTLTVGVSCGLPLFLYLRERALPPRQEFF